ncbi:histidine triad nucleotide-binding protein [Chloroflexota bacterium]
MADDCLFCKIVAGELPAKAVYESDTVLAFADIEPSAPHHVLVIPKLHIAGPLALDKTTASVMGELFLAAKTVAVQAGFAETGYRLVMNQGQQGGQSVFHMHLHVLGGRQMQWPPG